MATVNLGPCECCGTTSGAVICPAACRPYVTVKELTASPDSPVTLVDGDVTYTLFFARTQNGATFIPSSLIDTTTRASLRGEGSISKYFQDYPGAPACITRTFVTGADNVQRLQSDGAAAFVYSPSLAKRGQVGTSGRASEHFILYSETNSTTGFPSFAAVWAWDWANTLGIIKGQRSLTGVDDQGNPATTFPAIDIGIDFVMPVGCNDDGTCTTLSAGDLFDGETAFACDCCGEPAGTEGCGPCDNPLP